MFELEFFQVGYRFHWAYWIGSWVMFLFWIGRYEALGRRVRVLKVFLRSFGSVFSSQSLFDLSVLIGNALIKGSISFWILSLAQNWAYRVQQVLDWFWIPSHDHEMGPFFWLFSSFLAFIVDDAARWGHHVLSHKWEFLWRFHRFHHEAERLYFWTLYRTHPVEALMGYVRNFLVWSTIVGILVWWNRGPVSFWSIAGLNGFTFLFNQLGALWRHSHIPLSLGFLEKFMVSPRAHQFHHSLEGQSWNYGAALNIWDRLAGTWREVSDGKLLSGWRWVIKRRSVKVGSQLG